MSARPVTRMSSALVIAAAASHAERRRDVERPVALQRRAEAEARVPVERAAARERPEPQVHDRPVEEAPAPSRTRRARRPRPRGSSRAVTMPRNPATAPIHAERQHLERQPRPDAAGDDRRHRHRAQPEQQAEAWAERGAGEHDEEEDAAAAAGQVDQPQQARDRRQHAEDRDGRAVHRAAPHLERRPPTTTSAPTSAATSGASPLCAWLGNAVDGQPERVEERGRAEHAPSSSVDHDRRARGAATPVRGA